MGDKFKKMLGRSTRSGSMTRRALSLEDNNQNQELGGNNDTTPSLQEEDQVESDPETFASILEGIRRSNDTISDQVIPPRQQLVPTTNDFILSPSTVPPPTPNSRAGSITQNLGNSRGNDSQEELLEAIEDFKNAD